MRLGSSLLPPVTRELDLGFGPLLPNLHARPPVAAGDPGGQGNVLREAEAPRPPSAQCPPPGVRRGAALCLLGPWGAFLFRGLLAWKTRGVLLEPRQASAGCQLVGATGERTDAREAGPPCPLCRRGRRPAPVFFLPVTSAS